MKSDQLIDKWQSCTHDNTVKYDSDTVAGDVIMCVECGHQETESEWTERMEKREQEIERQLAI